MFLETVGDEVHGICTHVALVRVPFYFINLLPTSLLYISILLPESVAAQAAYTKALLPRSGSGPNCVQALGSSSGLLQDPIL
jgi:hypothetical protein